MLKKTICLFLLTLEFLFTPLKAHALELQDLSFFHPIVAEKDFNQEMAKARLEDLEWHKRLGHLTMGLALATAITGIIGRKKIDDARDARGGAKSKDDASKLNLHMGLAALTTASYWTTAAMAIKAPKSDAFEDESKRVWHKRLAWVHGSAMVLAPILGVLAFKDYHDGQDPHGLAKLHRPVAWTAFVALTSAFTVMTF